MYNGKRLHLPDFCSARAVLAMMLIVELTALLLVLSRQEAVMRSGIGFWPDLARTSLSTDNVFRDDKAIHQLATMTGSVKEGYVANLTIGV